MIDDCTAIILAGGASTRMGQDKALLNFKQEPLLHRAIRQVKTCFKTHIISVRQHKQSVPFLQVCDSYQGHGPMVGIATAMTMTDTNWFFVIACDMPFVSTTLIQAMAEQRQQQHAIVPVVHGIMQPLFAFYAKDCLPTLQTHLHAGQYSMQKVIATFNASMVNEATCRHYDPELLSFFDLDTMADVARGLLLPTPYNQA